MKRSILLIAALIVGMTLNPAAANESSKVESFTVTPNEVELTASSTRVEFELVVSHPSGIENLKTEVSITSSRNDNLLVSLSRTDSPINTKLTKVTFKGGIDLPRNLISGAYTFSASPVKNNLSAGYQYSTGTIAGPKVRELVGAQYGILVRNFGDLNLDYVPFNGPAYDTSLGIAYEDSIRYSANNSPKFNVGETYNPLDYFEVRVPGLPLSIKTSTPLTCTSDGKIMRFIAEGPCAFSVSTPKTKDYIGKTVSLNSVIAAARVKIQLVVEKVANQTAKDLPKSLELFPVYSASTGYVLPKSETPTTCIASGYFVRLISGGTCTLSYQSPETSTYRASDIYYQTFEIVREPQSLDFNLPNSAKLNEKTLTFSAKASSAATVTFKTSDNTVCTVEGEKLNFLKAGNCEVTASQAGTATLSPVSKTISIQIIASDLKKARTIMCVKGAKKIKVKAVKPKCPKGYVKER